MVSKIQHNFSNSWISFPFVFTLPDPKYYGQSTQQNTANPSMGEIIYIFFEDHIQD
jgi:hypothetical protein